MSIRKVLLAPFAWIYDLVTRLRNRMYDIQWKPSVSFDIPIINVGNLAVGGTGKTPMVEYIVRLLSHTRVAVLSRGYGRNTKGLRFISANDSPRTVGDEPYQMAMKFGEGTPVAVCEDRVFAVPHMLDQYPDVQAIILDDAFQHRRIRAGFNLLLTTYQNPFYNDSLMPAGRLREHARGAQRAQAVIVTKCPAQLSHDEMEIIRVNVKKFTSAPVFFACIDYGVPVPITAKASITERIILVSGVANHMPYERYAREHFIVLTHLKYRDHYRYTMADIARIEELVKAEGGSVSILTTEKDKGKLEQFPTELPFFYLPIEFKFLTNGKEFDALITDFVAPNLKTELSAD